MDHPLPPEPTAIPLAERGVLALGGPDRVAFLQGLVSGDVAKVGPERAAWAAFLTPQGKFLHEMVILAQGETLLLDVEAGRRDDLLRRIKLYKLRTKVELSDATDRFQVAAVVGRGAAAAVGLADAPGTAGAFAGGVACVDPRHGDLGVRLVLPRDAAPPFPAGDFALWDRLRLGLGIPDGSRDLLVDKSILLENGFDELGGVSWDKGCYMGQELTARTKYRGLVKKRLLPVAVDGPLPEPGTPVMAGAREVGEVRSGRDGLALALLRVDALAEPLGAGDARITPLVPAWVRLPEKA